MEKLSATPGSKLWTFMSQYPLLGKSEAQLITKERLKLLNYLSMMERDIIDIEALLTGWDKTAIAASFYRFSRFVNQFDKLFVSNFTKFNSKFYALDMEKEKKEPTSEDQTVDKAPVDLLDFLPNGLLSDIRYSKIEFGKNKLYISVLDNISSFVDFLKTNQLMPPDFGKGWNRKEWINIFNNLFARAKNQENQTYIDKLFELSNNADTKKFINNEETPEVVPTKNLSSVRKDIGFSSIVVELLSQQGIQTDSITKMWQEIFDLDDKDILPKYNELLNNINTLANTNLSSIEEIAKALKEINDKKQANYHPILQKIARKRFQRALNRLRLNVSRDLESKRILELADMLKDFSVAMDYTQEFLQLKDIDMAGIRHNVHAMYEDVANICKEFTALAKEYNNFTGEYNIKAKKKLHLIRTTDISLLERKGEYFEGLIKGI